MGWSVLAFTMQYEVLAPVYFGVHLLLYFAALATYFRRAGDRMCPLVHLTYLSTVPKIVKTQRFLSKGPAVFALRESVFKRCRTPLERILATMLFSPASVAGAVAVPMRVRHLFELIFPMGPYTALKCISGNYVAHYRNIPFNDPDATLQATALQTHAKVYLLDGLTTLLALVVFLTKIEIIFFSRG